MHKDSFRRKTLLAAASITMVVRLSPAATVEVWENDSTDHPAVIQTKITIQGSACRIDLSPQVTRLLNVGTGNAYELLHWAQAYTRKSLAEFAAASPCADATDIRDGPLQRRPRDRKTMIRRKPLLN